MGVGLHQGYHFVTILFVIFMDRISRHSRGEEGIQFEDLGIASLLFADDAVPLASSDCDLQNILGWFTVVGMRVITSKSEAMVLCWKTVDCFLWDGSAEIRRKLRVELFLLPVKRSRFRWFEHLIRILLESVLLRFSRRIQLVGDAGVEYAGEDICLIWLGNASGSPRKIWKTLLQRGMPGLPCLACCHCDPVLTIPLA